ncbi:MAG: hypothetical protein K2I12_06355 [Duncaniella sp.]|nr:hypothetical protein [Duncaniella sp.]
MEEKTLIALEIGSSKIKGAVGTVDTSGSLNVKAVEEERICDIVHHGCILNVVETASAVRNVVGRLEQRLAPRKVQGVYLSIGGRSLSASAINIERRMAQETEITRSLIEEITDEALSSAIPDRDVVSVTPRELLVVNGTPTSKPVGMIGSHVSASLNLITCRSQLVRNLSRVIEERLGLRIVDTFVRPLAEADLVLTSEEKRLGCMLVDFGAETTTVAIYKNGVLVHLATIPMGSRNITRDITALNHLEERAEELKIQGGSALPGQESGMMGGGAEYAAVNNYVAARAGEIILNIVKQIEYAGFTPDRLPEGIVIIGRGARLNGFNQRLEQMSELRVRTGAVGNKVRILDGRISGADAVDVISILTEAARNFPSECLSPKPIESRPIVNDTPVYQRPVETPTYQRPAVATPTTPAAPATPATPATPAAPATPVTPAAATTTHTPPFNPPIPPRPAVERRPPVIERETPREETETRQESQKKPSIWRKTFGDLRTRVANLMSDNLYENDDE